MIRLRTPTQRTDESDDEYQERLAAWLDGANDALAEAAEAEADRRRDNRIAGDC